MIFNKNNKQLPFEKETVFNSEVVKNDPTMVVERNSQLDLRDLIYIAALIVGFSVIFVINGLGVLSLISIASVLVWCFTFMFIETPNRIPLNFILNYLWFVGIWFLAGGGTSPVGVIPLVIGTTALTAMNQNRRAVYRCPECIKRSLPASIVSIVSTVISFLVSDLFFDVNRYPIVIIISVLIMVFISFVVTSTTSTKYYMNAGSIAEESSYLDGRIIFAVIACVMFAVNWGYGLILNRFSLTLPVIVIEAVIGLIVTIYMLIRKHARNVYFIIEIGFILVALFMNPGIQTLLVIIVLDIVVNLFLRAYKRRLVYVNKSKYFEGMPTLVIALAIILLIIELI